MNRIQSSVKPPDINGTANDHKSVKAPSSGSELPRTWLKHRKANKRKRNTTLSKKEEKKLSHFNQGLEEIKKTVPEMTHIDRILLWKKNTECDMKKDAFTLTNGAESCSPIGSLTEQKFESMICVRKEYKKVEAQMRSCTGSLLRRDYKKEKISTDLYGKLIEDGSDLEKNLEENPIGETKEEFYKYLGIDTKPPEARFNRPDITNLDIFKRRSLRVRYQKLQNVNKSDVSASTAITMPPLSDKSKESDTKETAPNLKPQLRPSKTNSHKENSSLKHTNTSKPQNAVSSSETPLITPKEKRTTSIKNNLSVPVKYLMRSRINLSDSKLRSGRLKKQSILHSRYLNFIKNKHELLLTTKRIPLKGKLQIPSKPKLNSSISKTNIKTERQTPIELPKSPIPQVPDSTVNLQCTPSDQANLIQVSSSSTLSTEISLYTLRNPLNQADGKVLYAYVIEESLVIVQQTQVSFWRYSQFKYLVGMEQTWELVGRKKRHNHGKYNILTSISTNVLKFFIRRKFNFFLQTITPYHIRYSEENPM